MKISDEARIGFGLGFAVAFSLCGAFAAIMLAIFLF